MFQQAINNGTIDSAYRSIVKKIVKSQAKKLQIPFSFGRTSNTTFGAGDELPTQDSIFSNSPKSKQTKRKLNTVMPL